MHIHVYDIMNPGYVPPTSFNEFHPTNLPLNPTEAQEFHVKVVNQYDEDILVYLDTPPSRKGEKQTRDNKKGGGWAGWNGPTKTLRGDVQEGQHNEDRDPWVGRILIADNEDPRKIDVPAMRTKADGTPLGAFYVPKGHHLRIHTATKDLDGGWFHSGGSCPDNIACAAAGSSMWVTRADAYNFPSRAPLLLVELNFDGQNGDFSKGNTWLDFSAVDGLNANMQIIYGDVNKRVFSPLF